MIVATEAVVLHSMRYRETSKIVSLYTRDYGKLSVIAKGARDMKNRFGGALEPMSHISAIIYKKEKAGLCLISKADIISPSHNLTNEQSSLACGLAVVELLSIVMHDEEKNDALFDVVTETLHKIEDHFSHPLPVLAWFMIRFFDIGGYKLSLSHCVLCGRPFSGMTYSYSCRFIPQNGTLYCGDCSGRNALDGLPVLPGTVQFMNTIELGGLTDPSVFSVEIGTANEAVMLLQNFLQVHITGARTLRSLKMLL